jgi:hypothetical protein
VQCVETDRSAYGKPPAKIVFVPAMLAAGQPGMTHQMLMLQKYRMSSRQLHDIP